MASFKLNIADPKTGKCYQKEVKDAQAAGFMGKKINDTIKGEDIEMPGYEFVITGGSDYCGFPMRSGILGVRKRINLMGGVGFRGKAKGIRRRKTVCGHKVNDKIVQINLKASKQGARKLDAIFGKEEAPQQENKTEPSKDAEKLSEKKGLQDSKNLEKGLEKAKPSQKESKPEERPAEQKPKEEPKKE